MAGHGQFIRPRDPDWVPWAVLDEADERVRARLDRGLAAVRDHSAAWANGCMSLSAAIRIGLTPVRGFECFAQ
jgi:hypothetical protein